MWASSQSWWRFYLYRLFVQNLSNELAWVEAQHSKGLFDYSACDGTKDFMNTDGIPLGKYTTQVVGGGAFMVALLCVLER
jgi:hypothetical protein